MAQNTTIAINGDSYTLLTNADVTSATFQNNGSNAVYIAGTASAVAPTDDTAAIRYNPGTGERSSVTLAELFPGAGAVRLYAKCVTDGNSQVFISHA